VGEGKIKIGMIVRGMNTVPNRLAALPRNVVEISKRIKMKSFILTDGREDIKYTLEGLPVYQVKGSVGTLKSFKELVNLTKSLDVDVVNFHGSLIGGIFLTHSWEKLNVPIVLNLYTSKLLLQDFKTLKLSDIRFHGRILDDVKEWTGSFIPSFLLRHYFVGKDIKKIVVPSQRMKRSFEETLRQEKLVCCIPPGVDLKRFKRSNNEKVVKMKEKLGFKEDDVVVLHSGLGSVLRGADDLILAMRNVIKKLPRAKLLLTIFSGGFGGPEYLLDHVEYIKRLAFQKLPHNSVKIISQPIQNIEDYYSLSDLVVLPYRFVGDFPECPLTLLEAMACGKIVISTNVGAIHEYIRNRICLVPTKNVKDVAKRIIKILSDKELYRTISESNRSFIEKEHNWETLSKKMEKVYKEACN